jgi:hypothetical protein
MSLAAQAMIGNCGGVLASFVFLSKDGPRYVKGYCILIGIMTMSASICAFMTIYYRRENARRDAKYKAPAEYTAEEKALEREKGDSASFFRFTV